MRSRQNRGLAAANAPDCQSWIEPKIALATHTELPLRELKRMQKLVEERRDEIVDSWKAHFES